MLGHVNYVTIVTDYIIKETYMQAVAHFIETFVPEHYDIFLDLNREQKTFTGKVSISGEAKGEKISLHQKDLTIQ